MKEADLKIEVAAMKATKALFKHIYVVFYEIIGSRCNGTYLVKAHDKREAKKFVRALDEDYVVRDTPQSFFTYCDEVEENPFDVLTGYVHDAAEHDKAVEHLVQQALVMPNDVEYGFTHCMECGT